MRIVYVAPCRTIFPSRSASSIHMIRMCEAFVELGHEVFFIISDQGYSSKDILEFYGVVVDVSIFKIKVLKSRFGNVSYAMKAGLAARNFDPDYVVGRSVPACAFACMLQCKTVLDSHGPVWQSNILDLLLFRYMAKSSQLVRMTVNSNALKRLYEEEGAVPRCGIAVAFNGSKQEIYTAHVKGWPGRSSSQQIGYFGNLYPGRGIDLIMSCAEKMPDCDFHVFGGGGEDVEAWKKKQALANVFFHGFVNNHMVANYRAKCDVLLAPYQASGVAVAGGGGDSSRYMNPIKIIEYMSSGKAIVCSDILVLREVLGDDGALFADPGNVDEWVSAINSLKNDDVRYGFAQRALERFNRGLTWHSRAKNVLNIV